MFMFGILMKLHMVILIKQRDYKHMEISSRATPCRIYVKKKCFGNLLYLKFRETRPAFLCITALTCMTV